MILCVRGTVTGVCGRHQVVVLDCVCVRERGREQTKGMEYEGQNCSRKKEKKRKFLVGERERGGEREADRKEVSTRLHRDIVYIQFGRLCSLSSVKTPEALNSFSLSHPLSPKNHS